MLIFKLFQQVNVKPLLIFKLFQQVNCTTEMTSVSPMAGTYLNDTCKVKM